MSLFFLVVNPEGNVRICKPAEGWKVEITDDFTIDANCSIGESVRTIIGENNEP
jgi:hypothetical protein